MPPAIRSSKRKSTNSPPTAAEPSAPTRGEDRAEKLELFLNCFDEEVNSRISSMERKFGKIIDMVDRVMAVHLLKIPVAIKRMKFKDFLGGTDQAAAIAASITDNAECTIATLPLKTTKKKIKPLKLLSASTSELHSDQLKFNAKSTTAKHRTVQKVNMEYHNMVSILQIMIEAPPNLKAAQLTSGLASEIPQNNSKSVSSSKRKALFSSSTPISNVKAPAVPREIASTSHKRLPKMSKSGRKALTCSPVRVDKSQPFINIPLADGKAIYAVGVEVDDIDVESLDPNTLTSIKSLVIHLTALCEKAQHNAAHANSI